jgi:hypothetical protein
VDRETSESKIESSSAISSNLAFSLIRNIVVKDLINVWEELEKS